METIDNNIFAQAEIEIINPNISITESLLKIERKLQKEILRCRQSNIRLTIDELSDLIYTYIKTYNFKNVNISYNTTKITGADDYPYIIFDTQIDNYTCLIYIRSLLPNVTTSTKTENM